MRQIKDLSQRPSGNALVRQPTGQQVAITCELCFCLENLKLRVDPSVETSSGIPQADKGCMDGSLTDPHAFVCLLQREVGRSGPQAQVPQGDGIGRTRALVGVTGGGNLGNPCRINQIPSNTHTEICTPLTAIGLGLAVDELLNGFACQGIGFTRFPCCLGNEIRVAISERLEVLGQTVGREINGGVPGGNRRT